MLSQRAARDLPILYAPQTVVASLQVTTLPHGRKASWCPEVERMTLPGRDLPDETPEIMLADLEIMVPRAFTQQRDPHPDTLAAAVLTRTGGHIHRPGATSRQPEWTRRNGSGTVTEREAPATRQAPVGHG